MSLGFESFAGKSRDARSQKLWRDKQSSDANKAKKETLKQRYPELARRNQYGALTVLACETGGRWHHRALSMVSTLIEAKTQTIAPLLRQAAALAYHRRWWGILSTALQRTVATSLLDHPGMGNMPGPGPEPPLGDLLQIAMEIPEVSRLPLRDD